MQSFYDLSTSVADKRICEYIPKNSFTYAEMTLVKGKLSDWRKIHRVSIPAWSISGV